MALNLQTIICSTRPGRQGPAIARWFHERAEEHGRFEATLVDLADFALPVYDEPKHPRLRQYQHEHTRRWSASVEAADAFVLCMPEYNFGPPPSLLNALNYVYAEWNYKPAAFVSYGGVSGGLRAVQTTKLTLTTLKMMPVLEGVTIPGFAQQVVGDVFTPTEIQTKSAADLLDELWRVAEALKPLRRA